MDFIRYKETSSANDIYDWITAEKGGDGSGNFGHAGRPGEVGGSAPGDGEGKRKYDAAPSEPDKEGYQKPSPQRDIDYAEDIIHNTGATSYEIGNGDPKSIEDALQASGYSKSREGWSKDGYTVTQEGGKYYARPSKDNEGNKIMTEAWDAFSRVVKDNPGAVFSVSDIPQQISKLLAEKRSLGKKMGSLTSAESGGIKNQIYKLDMEIANLRSKLRKAAMGVDDDEEYFDPSIKLR